MPQTTNSITKQLLEVRAAVQELVITDDNEQIIDDLLTSLDDAVEYLDELSNKN
jgi:hypothetical protein